MVWTMVAEIIILLLLLGGGIGLLLWWDNRLPLNGRGRRATTAARR